MRQAVCDGDQLPRSTPLRYAGLRGTRAGSVLASEPEPIEARIPTSHQAGWKSRVVCVDGEEVFAEAFRHLALRIRRECVARGTSSVLVSSAVAREGKTLTACNLALGLASMQKEGRVALVDFDLRSPSVAASIGIDPGRGFEKVLRGELPVRSAAVHVGESLDVYPGAAPVRSAHEVLAGPAVADALDELALRYAFVVCDGPPALPVPDVELLVPHVGACCVVVRSGVTSRSALRELVERLPPQKLIGSFLNEARVPRHFRDYYTLAYGEVEPEVESDGERDTP
jgi:non-specific protein-tyrosine kinase